MIRLVSRYGGAAAAVLLVALSGCGKSDGGTGPQAPPGLKTITVTTAPVSFATLGRTAQFAAVGKDSTGATMAGVSFTWRSSNPAAATISGTGLVTAVANGTTNITASSGSIQSGTVQVTVQQVGAQLTLSPASLAFGAIGSTHQVAATLKDSGGAAISSPVIAWAISDTSKASVSVSGLVAAKAVTTAADTVTASAGAVTAALPVTVTQVPASVTVAATSAGPDTLKTTGRTRQYAATVKDSNGVVAGGASVTWSSSATGVATVSASGLATAVADGSTNITATDGAVSGFKALVVRRYASTFSVSPSIDSIKTAGGTAVLNGTATDSNTTALPIAWLSRITGIATVSPASGTTTTVTAKGNGSVYIVISGGTRSDSSHVFVSGQPTASATDSVSVGDDFFKSRRNNTQPAVDTIAVNGTMTWIWVGLNNHSVQSTNTPTFTSSTTKTSGTYAVQFTVAGTYTYNCVVHGNIMTGTVVVK